MNAEFARFIRAGCDNPSAIRFASNDERFITEGWGISLFNGGKKSVHIDMNNFSWAYHTVLRQDEKPGDHLFRLRTSIFKLSKGVFICIYW